MQFSFIQEANILHVTMTGAIGNEKSDELRENLQELLELDYTEVVFNMSFVTFIASAAIGKLIVFFKDCLSKGRRMRVKGINDQIYELFHYIKLYQLFPIER